MLKIGVQSRGIINEKVYEEGYKRIKASGIECIDYDIVSEDGNIPDVSYYVRHSECAKKYGLSFSQVHAPVIKYHKEYINKVQKSRDLEFIIGQLKKSIEIASVLESPYLVIHALNIAEKSGEDEEFGTNMALFSAIAPHAIEFDITLCIENVPARKEKMMYEGACSSAKYIRTYIDKLNSVFGKKCFGACFDVGHANLLQKDVEKEIEILGNDLKALHIHDNDGKMDMHQMPYVFADRSFNDRNIDWSSYLIALRKIGYKGVLSFETNKLFVTMPGVLQKDILCMLYKIGMNFSTIITYEKILEKYKSHQIILFGAGKMFDVYMDNFGINYKPAYVVDNSESMWGKTKRGIPICSPEILKKNIQKNYVVIICSGFYEEITNQLKKMKVSNIELSEEIYRLRGKPE